jgi:hypothetical protein
VAGARVGDDGHVVVRVERGAGRSDDARLRPAAAQHDVTTLWEDVVVLVQQVRVPDVQRGRGRGHEKPRAQQLVLSFRHVERSGPLAVDRRSGRLGSQAAPPREDNGNVVTLGRVQ